ncbi:hypothetical protein PBV87_01060 [Niameybacter massiliensis]|uniref:Uncharacterized protein n=1 Tax=Holtiella tumoricola TaxID=3018743 RepID=A0AA42DJG1_9FIRM|nr:MULTISPECIES: hypothetical protein [Lachnospirales]MDA3730103.1 hypothetical protein [Holtiella tumoricola]
MTTSPVPYRSGNQLDDQVNTEFMRVCKSVLPYLDRGMQKNLAISLKLLEFISVVQLYNSDTIPVEPEPSMMRGENWENRLLTDIRNSLDSDKTYIIDALMKLSEVKNIMSRSNQQADTSTADIVSSIDPEPTSDSASSPFNFANFFNSMPSSNTGTDPEPQHNTSSGPNPADMINAFAPLLDDKQKQLLNLLSVFMKPSNS